MLGYSLEVTMTKYALKALTVLAVAMTLAVAPARAKQSDEMTMTIPFAFTVGDTTLPAGTYRVRRTSATTGTYLISNADGEIAAAVTSPARVQERDEARAKLVFHIYGGEYFLSQIWLPTSFSGTELATSRRERRLAGAGAEPRFVALVEGRR
jgi:hypothetical protein